MEIDSLSVIHFVDTASFLRFRLNSSEALENVAISIENPLTGVKAESRCRAYLSGSCEMSVQMSPLSKDNKGALVWYVTVSYEMGGIRRRLEGEVKTLLILPCEARKVAEQLSVTINNNIHNGNASDVHVSQRAVDDLAKLATAENPFDELRKIVTGPERVWSAMDIYEAGALPVLPPAPMAAVCESVTLDLGVQRIRFFARRIVKFGRRRDGNDISLRPADGMPDLPYRAIGRAHCYFEHNGDKAVVYDGQPPEGTLAARPSTYGTFWNDVRMLRSHELAAGDEGVLSFGGRESDGLVAMEVRACSSAGVCRNCPHANRTWCGEGRRPALMLTRRDGIAERFVALWSCFPMEEADPSFEGVVIFRKDGGFAWRRGRRCGWLVPGQTIDTDYGQIKVS